ncbi:MAG: hypothetical protein RLZZ303_2223 [Candidatus Hydrogenedentota bacterium]|jgi:beta-N-acetylhexosaminidase
MLAFMTRGIAAALTAGLCWAAAGQAPSAFGGDAPAPTPEEGATPEAPAGGEFPALPEKPWEEAPLRARIAQLMLVTMEGEQRPSTADFGFLKTYTPAGAIVDRASSADAATAYALKLRGAQQLTGIPFWVGANVYRLTRPQGNAPSAFLPLPSMLAVGAAHRADAAESLGRLLAAHMGGMGFNFHLGPSLSLAPESPEAAPIIHTFGGDPAFVSLAGQAVLSAFGAAGVDAMPAGFPGGGFNAAPNAAASLTTPREQLETRDLAPYIALVRAQTPMLHVDTTLAPTLDSAGRPACLSREIVTGLLREALGYEGLIVAGPLDAPDLAATLDPAEAALMALRAGADLLYWQTSPTLVKRVVDRLVTAVETGLLEEELVTRAFTRVIETKRKKKDVEPGKQEEAAKASLSNRRDLEDSIRAIERQSITLIRNRDNLLPLEKGDGPIGVTGVVYLEGLVGKMEEYVKPISEQRVATAQHLGDIQDFEIDRLTRRIRGLRTVVVVLTDAIRPQGAQRLVKEFKAKDMAVVAVVLGHPKLAMHLGEADAILLGYNGAGSSDYTLDAVGEALMGDAAFGPRNEGETFRVNAGEPRTYHASEALRIPAGRLPVHLGGEFPLGHSVSYGADTALKSVSWDFGDGVTSNQPSPEHVYAQPGRYEVVLRASGKSKQSAEARFIFIAE